MGYNDRIMAVKEIKMIKAELATLAFFESDAVESRIRLEDRFKDAESFRKSLWRPDLFIMTLIPLLIGALLIFLGLWIIAALVMLPGVVVGVILGNDLVAYVLWSRSDSPKYHERYLWERRKSLEISKSKLIRAQKARIQDLVRSSISVSRLPEGLRQTVEPILKEKLGDVKPEVLRDLILDPDEES